MAAIAITGIKLTKLSFPVAAITPAPSSSVSPGKKKPMNIPDSAKMTAAISNRPPVCIRLSILNINLILTTLT